MCGATPKPARRPWSCSGTKFPNCGRPTSNPARHRFVDERADAFGDAGVALLGQELQDVVQEIRTGGWAMCLLAQLGLELAAEDG